MKVCYVLSHFYPYVGGAEQAFMDLILNLLKKGINVRVITCSNDGKDGHVIYNGIDIYYYNWNQFMGHPILRKRDLIEHIEWADIVNSAVYSPVPVVSKLCQKFHKPHVCDVYEVLGNRWYWVENNKLKAFMLKMYEKYIVNHFCDIFIASSMATKKDLDKCNKKAKSKCIYWISDNTNNKFEIDKDKFNNFFGVSDGNIVFLNYGRPGKTKGIFIYLDAIIKTIDCLSEEQLEKIRFCFIMASEPHSERERFINIVNSRKLNKYVIVKNSVERIDLENYRMCADYIVVPSITEGFGLSAIEACEASKKLIHSSAGSLPEVTFGEVAEFKNMDSSDLASILIDIILKKKTFVFKEKKDFSGATISSQYIDVYQSLIDKYSE